MTEREDVMGGENRSCGPTPCPKPCPPNEGRKMGAYAQYAINGDAVTAGELLPLAATLYNSTGNFMRYNNLVPPSQTYPQPIITQTTATVLTLAQGYVYEISYMITGTTPAAGFVQVTPIVNGVVDDFTTAVASTTTESNLQATVFGSFLLSTADVAKTLSLRFDGTAESDLQGVLTIRVIDVVA